MLDYTELNGEPANRETPIEPIMVQRPASLASIISRVEQAVDEETAAIRTDMKFDLKASNARKSRYLYELSRAVKGAGAIQMVAEQREAIVRLREKLARNEAAIRAHLNAVNEVADADPGRNPARRGRRHVFGWRVRKAMIKFIAAGLWLCAATIGAVFYSFQSSVANPEGEAPAALLGGLDYVKTPVLSVPVLKQNTVAGYFLTRLVYTVEPEKLKKLSIPAEALFSDEIYTYLFSNAAIDFTEASALDLDAFRAGIRESINKRVGEELIHDVMVEQIDFLTKEEIRDNSARRRTTAEEEEGSEPAAEAAHEEKPAH